MKTYIPFLGIRIQFLVLLAALLMGSSSLFGQIHIFPAAPRICLGDTVLLTVVADDPGNIPTFFSWSPSDSLSNPSGQSTLAYPIDTITYFVETNAGGASVTVYVMAPPATSFTGLEDTYYCANTPPITLNGTPTGGNFFTDAATGLVGNILTPAEFPTGALYNVYYAIMYGDTSMCTDTVSNNVFIGAVPVATFTGLSASYCFDEGPVTLVPDQVGGAFSIDPPSSALVGDNIDLSLLSTGTTYTITYQITAGDPPCSASSSQSFIVNEQPFVSFSGLPGGSLCSNLPPITLIGSPAGGTFFTNAPTGLTGNVLTPALVPFNTSYTLSYAFTAANGCADTATQNIFVFQEPTVGFSGLSPSYCVGDGPVVTLTGSPSGGFFTTNVPGITFSGDVVDLDLNLVPISTSFTITYTSSAGGDPPCNGSNTQSFIVNEPPFVSFSGLPGGSLCSNLPPITLIGSPAGGTFFTNAPTGLTGNVLTPALVPFNTSYTLSYAFTAASGCADTATQNIFVFQEPTVGFSGLSPSYCVGDGPVITLTGSPSGGFFTTNVPGITFTGDVVDLDLNLVPIGTSFTITYTASAGGDPPCNGSSTQSFIVNPPPAISFSGLPATICANTPPITLTGSPAGGTFSTGAPSGLVGNILTPSNVPTGNEYSLTYTYTDANGCTNSTNQSFLVNALPIVSFTGLLANYCTSSPISTLVGSPAGGTFSTTAPAGLTGNILDPSLVPVGISYTITYTYTDGSGCSNTETQAFIVNTSPSVSFSGLSATYCANDAPVTLVGSPGGGVFSTTAPSGLTGDILDPSQVPTGTSYSITYTVTVGCVGSSTQSFIVNELPFVSFSGLPGGSLCSNLPPITLIGSPAGGTFFTNAPTGLTGNVLTPALVPFNTSYTLSYAFTAANGCADTATQNIFVYQEPTVGFSGLSPSYCVGDGPVITLTGSPSGGFFTTNVPGITFSGDVVDLDLNLVPIGTSFTITYTTSAGGDPPCNGSNTQSFIINPPPAISFSGLPATICANTPPITLTGSPAGGTFSTGAPSGLVGNILTPSNVPTGNEYSLTYTYTDANGCTNSTNQSFLVNALPIVDAGNYPPVCISAPDVLLSGTPAGGTFVGTGVTGNTFDPSVGTQTITYIFTDANGCSNFDETTITVNPLPVVDAGTYAPVCISATNVVLIGSPVGGTFSGTGVTGNTFNPAVGIQTITYTYTDANGCSNTDQATILVNSLPIVDAGTYSPVCISVSAVALTGTPAGGTFSGTGVTGNSFNPAVGTQTITYTFTDPNGCTNTDQVTIVVNPLPIVDAGTYPPVCTSAPDVVLTGTPAGGTFVGTGVTSNTFDPSFGTQTITYIFTDANGCSNFDETTITVNPLPVVDAGTYAPVCISAPNVVLIGSPVGGIFSGTGVTGNTFNPAVGTQTITYTFTDANGCTNSDQATIVVNPLPIVDAGTYSPVCISVSAVALTGTPAGGTFSGTGVTGNSFNPAVGTQTITYTYTDANGCTNTDQATIVVNPLPIVDTGTYPPVCISAPDVVLTGTPAGGTFVGTGVTGNTFDPSVGTQTIAYIFTDANGCSNFDETTITVNPLPVVDAGTYAPVCISAPNVVLIGSPVGGIFSGTGVTGNTFNPAVGTQTITYTFTDANGCTNSDQATIVVNPLPIVDAGTYSPVCISVSAVALTGTPAGGTFSGTGVTGNSFNPAVGTQTITYTYTDANGCTNTDQATIVVNPLPIVDTGTYPPVCISAPDVVLTGTPAGGTFVGTGVTGNTFDPSVGTQTIAYIFTDANGCSNFDETTITVNPLPVVDAGTYAPVCISAPNVVLVGSPVGGTFSGTGVTGNTFNPAVGTQTITYTYTDANGCSNTDQATILVNSLPIVDAGTYAPVCISVPAVVLTGTPAGGTFSGTGVTGNSFNPAVGTQTITYTYTDSNGCTNTDQATIVVNPLPIVDAGTYAPVCISAPDVVLTGTPAGGTFVGTGVTGNTFDPSVGTQTIAYIFTDANGCSNFDETTITVNPLPVVDAGTYAPVCISAPNVVLIGSPIGGTFSGTGVTGNTFNPAVGTQTITYTFTTANGCINSDQATIVVNPLPIVDAGTYSPVCISVSNVTLAGTPAGGTFSGTGVTGNSFNPAVGTQTITYTYTNANGCINSDQATIVVNPLPIVDAGTYPPVCTSAPDVVLTGTPAGGTFVGTGVTGNTFDPSVGTQTIAYIFTDANGCSNFDETTITVNPLPVVDAGTYAPVCISAPNVVLIGSPVGGTFSGTGVTGNTFNPAVGTQTITYTYTNANGCTNSDQATIVVNSLPIVDAGTYPPVCISVSNVTLAGTPAGGTFSGTGVTGNSFNPAVGTQTITYTYTDANGCTNTDQVTIVVNPLPIVDAGSYPPVCISAPDVVLTGTPAGGTFVGTGVTGNTFDPSVGTQTIAYIFTDANGCSNFDETTITVNPIPTVDAGTYPSVCIDGPNVLLTGSPLGGTFSGAGVTNNSFDPSAGTQIITYTVTGTNGCTNSDETTIPVNPLPSVNAGTYPSVCSNEAPIILTGSPLGGTFSGIGVSGNTFDPSIGAQTITYTYTDANGCTNSDQTFITVNLLTTVDAGAYPALCLNAANLTLTGLPVGGVFSGIGVTGNSFNPAVGTQTITYSFTNINGCTNSDQATITVNSLPIVDAGAYPIVCSNAADLTLVGTPSNGMFTGIGVTGNVFDPSVGTQTITYSYTNINGCTNTDQATITINAATVVDAGSYTPVCFNGPVVALSGLPAGGTFSGIGVTGNNFNPAAGTQPITYTFTNSDGCTSSDQATILVNSIPTIDAGTYPETCIDGNDITLTGTPTGGSFSGVGVIGNTFDPSVGTQPITYTFTTAEGCTSSDVTTITSVPAISVGFSGLAATYCADAPNVALTGNPAGGEFTVNAPGGIDGTILIVSQIPTGAPYQVTYSYTSANGCSGTNIQGFLVNPLPIVELLGLPGQICEDALPITLSGTPVGGTFTTDSPTGLNGNILTPAEILPLETYSVTYSYTDVNGCTGNSQSNFTIYTLPVVDAGSYTSVCSNDSEVILYGNPATGIFSGTGVIGNTFDPSAGSQLLTFTYTDPVGCTNTDTVTIFVNPLPSVSFTALAPFYCSNDEPLPLTGTPAGGNFSALIPEVLANPTTNPTFLPNALTLGGSSTIFYTYQSPQGCTAISEQTTTVNVAPKLTIADTLVLCGESGQVIVSPGGPDLTYLWSGGQTTQNITVTQDGTYSVSVTDLNNCTSKDSAEVFIQAGQQFISNLLVSNTACIGDTVRFFDISEVLTGVDSYFWTFGDGATSTLRDPFHIYTNPGPFDITLTATSVECENVSVAKTIQIQSCRQDGSDDIFDVVNVYPNPAESAFNLDISLNEAKNLLVTLSDVHGRELENHLLQNLSLYQLHFSALEQGIYFVKIQGETKSVVVKVLVF